MTDLQATLCNFTLAQDRYLKAKHEYDGDILRTRYGTDLGLEQRMEQAAADMEACFKEALAWATPAIEVKQ